ncbi:MAG: Carboxylesterase NlhH [Verrucomicrobiota bacterium]
MRPCSKTVPALWTSLSCGMVWLAMTTMVCAQESGSGLDERFRRLDRDGDGRISSDEGKSLPFFKAADGNGDGFLVLPEAETYRRTMERPDARRTAGMEGDGAGSLASQVKPVMISETDSPVQVLAATAVDGRRAKAFWRRPKTDQRCPAIVFVHGGLTEFPEDRLQRQLRANPVVTRMLEAGYAVVQATFRTFEQDVLSRGPIEDVRAIVHALAKTPGVDPARIALFGGSGGGSIALELGSDPAVRAVVAGEPATVMYTGMLSTSDYDRRLLIMADPGKFLNDALRERTLDKLKSLKAPVLILHSDQHDLHKLNKPLFLPLMKQAGVRCEYREYPGYGHGFYFGAGDDRWGKGADDHVVASVLRDVLGFLAESMSVAAKPADPSPRDTKPPNPTEEPADSQK